MTAKEVLAELKSLGTEQARKTYRRHGLGENIFGVNYADLGKLHKRIKTDHALALQLWDTGTYEACVLATFIADPKQTDAKLLDKWAAGLADHSLSGAFGDYAAKSPEGCTLARKWIKDKAEFVQCCGWSTLGAALKGGTDGLSAKDAEALIADIEKRIHKAVEHQAKRKAK